jgi:hypothetical protein
MEGASRNKGHEAATLKPTKAYRHWVNTSP